MIGLLTGCPVSMDGRVYLYLEDELWLADDGQIKQLIIATRILRGEIVNSRLYKQAKEL